MSENENEFPVKTMAVELELNSGEAVKPMLFMSGAEPGVLIKMQSGEEGMLSVQVHASGPFPEEGAEVLIAEFLDLLSHCLREPDTVIDERKQEPVTEEEGK